MEALCNHFWGKITREYQAHPIILMPWMQWDGNLHENSSEFRVSFHLSYSFIKRSRRMIAFPSGLEKSKKKKKETFENFEFHFQPKNIAFEVNPCHTATDRKPIKTVFFSSGGKHFPEEEGFLSFFLSFSFFFACFCLLPRVWIVHRGWGWFDSKHVKGSEADTLSP